MNDVVKKKSRLIFIFLGFVIPFFYCFFYSNFDAEIITKWAYDLLTCIRDGRFKDFPEYTFLDSKIPTNYSLLTNLINSIWVSPLFLYEMLTKIQLSMEVYYVGYKALCFVFFLADVKLFHSILLYYFDEIKTKLLTIIFMTSSITCLAVLAKGQIEIVSLFFAFIGWKFFLERKYKVASIFLGIVVVLKPIVLLVILPIYLLKISKARIGIIVETVILTCPYMICAILTKLIMPEYYNYSAKSFDALGFGSLIDYFFSLKYNEILPFVFLGGLICFICYYLGIHELVQEWHYYVFAPSLMIVFGVLVCSSYQWFFYVLPLLIIGGGLFIEESDYYLLNFVCNLSLTVYFMCGENITFPLKKTSINYAGVYKEQFLAISKTCFFMVLLLYIVIMVLNEAIKVKKNETKTWYRCTLFCVQFLPQIMFVIISLVV